MKKMLLFIFILSASFIACQEDNKDGYHLSDNDNGFRLHYDLSSIVSATRSTIAVEDGEEQINSFYILFFENQVDGKFIHAIDVMNSSQSSIGSSGTVEINFEQESGLNNNAEYKILVCANVEDYTHGINGFDDLNAVCIGKTHNQVVSALQMSIKKDDQGELQPMSSSRLPMSCSVVKKPKENVSVEFTRSVSRFDVFCQAEGYELYSASIWNASIESSVWPDTQNDFNRSRTDYYYEVSPNSNKQIVGSLYAFENFVSSPVQNDDITTCLIIGLLNLDLNRVEYFRININADHMGQHLKRNNIYRTTIRNVDVPGAEDEMDAYHDPEQHLDIDINGWMLNTDGNVIYDDKNILALPTSLISLSSVGDSREYKLFTTGEGELTMTTEGIPLGVTVELQGHSLHIDAPERSIDWAGVLCFHIGKLTGSIIIEQKGRIEHFLDLNFDVKELPEFSYTQGDMSPWIDVTSSGSWTARIYGGNHLSFTDDATQVATIKGEPGDGFNIFTIQENTGQNMRHCFVVVSLEEYPEINRAIVLSQQKKPEPYLKFAENDKVVTVSASGATITDILLESNIEWTAKFTISSGSSSPRFLENGVQVSTISGTGNKSISIVIPANTVTTENVIIIEAKGKDYNLSAYSNAFIQTAKVDNSYIRFNPATAVTVPTAGSTISNIKVESNYSWQLEFLISTGTAKPVFIENNKEVAKITGTGNKTITVKFPSYYGNTNSLVYIVAKTTNAPSVKTATKQFSQAAYHSGSMLVVSNGSGIGNLVDATSTNYTDYVYGLGSFMRNKSYFGTSGTVVKNGGFTFAPGISESAVREAKIIQLVKKPTDAEFDMIYSMMQEDKTKFLMITGNDYATLRTIMTQFEKKSKAGYGTVYNHGLGADFGRYMNTGSSKKLIKYLLDGAAGKTTGATLNGYGNSAGLSQGTWPSTFIPIIYSGATGVCVFGIDPTHRLIFLSDPGIFGSNRTGNSNYPNYKNFQNANSDNSTFLKNLIAWLMRAGTENGFINNYK